jgi:nitrite reductase/ring-hydroxylating ferredoxin subunit
VDTNTQTDPRTPPPPRYPGPGMPSGWYVVATSRELEPGTVLSRHYFGRDLVLFRTQSGQAVVADAYCPHLGANLGDGRVEGETIRCPFHGFCFDAKGTCVANAYGTEPSAAARLRTWPVQEKNHVVLVYYHPLGEAPSWEVPAFEIEGWSGFLCRRYDVASHPQETSENSVDFGHFTNVHRFTDSEMTRPATTSGPLLTTGYAVYRSLAELGLRKVVLRVEYNVFVWGLGYSVVELHLPQLRADLRLFVLPVPVDDEGIHLRLGAMTRGGHFLPIAPLINRFVFEFLCLEVRQDIPVWERKRYIERPALVKGDGPIGIYRKWARQFYPDDAAVEAVPRYAGAGRHAGRERAEPSGGVPLGAKGADG